MLKLGLTGNIGSGKSTVASIFCMFGIPVFNSDEVGNTITSTQLEVIEAIKSSFGDHIYKDNKLDRKALGDIVFNDKAKLMELNAIVHPAVQAATVEWDALNEHMPLSIKESALIFEVDLAARFDAVIVVHAPKKLRMERVMARNGLSKKEIELRMSKQLSDEDKLKRGDYVVYNDGCYFVLEQVVNILKQLKAHPIVSSL